MMPRSLAEIQEHVDSIWVVDTHEHLCTEAEWLSVPEDKLDFSQLMHYVELDVQSAGIPVADMSQIRFTNLPEDQKWELFEPYWLKTRNTGFAKVVEQSVRDSFGLPGLNRDTYKEIGRCIKETRKPGRYKLILKDTAHIQISINDAWNENQDRELFLPVLRLDHFLWLTSRQDLQNLEKTAAASIGSLTDAERELGKAVERLKNIGCAAVKTAQAYVRGLRYEYASKEDANRAFEKLLTPDDKLETADSKTLSDYLFNRMVEFCIELDFPIQIHTGMAAGNAVRLEPTNPMFLTDTFLNYPEARFDLFHSGYPYWAEMGVLVKTFPNVRADLCWTHIISPSSTRRALGEWLEVIPANKIFAFGGDLGSVDIAAAHLKQARANVAEVLAEKVDRGYFTLDEAKDIATMILRDNAKEFYRLEF